MSENKLYLKPSKSGLLSSKHPWIFDGALDVKRGGDAAAGVAQLYTADNQFIAVGTYNPGSAIAFRKLSEKNSPIDTAFFVRLFQSAKALREAVVDAKTDGLRWINSEGDGVPGLTVDGYRDHFVVQVGTPAMHTLSGIWLEALQQVFTPKSITRKDSQSVANRERMTAMQQVAVGEPPSQVSFTEAGVHFRAAVLPGQKTGFFFDQREHRIRVSALATHKRVLDGYAYTGGFGAHALFHDAAFVTGVDSSVPACEMMETNYRLNSTDADRFEVIREDCVQYLKQTEREFDIVVLDPPALAKRRHHLPQAAKLYREIFECGMRRLPATGGYLSASSCSAAVDASALLDILRRAAVSAAKTVQVLHVGGAGADHPTSIFHPEGDYLKTILLRVQ